MDTDPGGEGTDDGSSDDPPLTVDASAAAQPPETPATVSVAASSVPKSSSRRRLVPFALLGIMTIGAVVAAFVAVRESKTPAEALASALTNTLNQKTAAVSLSIVVDEPGGTATITSSGTSSFQSQTGNQSMVISSGGQHIKEHIIVDGSEIYVRLGGGVIGKIVPGKSWVSVGAGQASRSGLSAGNGPSNSNAILQALAGNDNAVRGLGTSRVDGIPVTQYSVHLTQSQINRDVKRERLPDFARQILTQIRYPAVTYRLDISGANQLKELSTTLHLRVDGLTITEQISSTYSHFGTPVSVSAPPAHEVVPFETFLRIADEKNERVTI